MRYDAAIIGGGIAGSQAALTLARVNRSVLLFDDFAPRHRFAASMHNLVGADGADPARFYEHVHAELATYPHVNRVSSRVLEAGQEGADFWVKDAQAKRYEAHALLFACGVRDVLPPIPGLAEWWGTRVLHCSYCHGYEMRGKRLAVLTKAEHAIAHAHNLRSLSDQLHFLIEGPSPDIITAEELGRLGVSLMPQTLTAVGQEGEGLGLTLSDGSAMRCDALFIVPTIELTSELPFALGCQASEGKFVAANSYGQTHVPGVYVAGDASGSMQQFAVAASGGLLAAISIHNQLMHGA